MESERIHFQHRSIIEERLECSVNSGSVFGWEQNTYDVGSDQVNLKFLFSAADISYDRIPLDQWLLSSTHTHEIGHYVLGSATGMGITLRKLSALSDGLAAIIADEMLTRSGRLTVPFDRYLRNSGKDRHVARMIEALRAIDALRQQLTDGWRITNELFALCWSVMSGMITASTTGMLSPSQDEAKWAMSVIADRDRVDRVMDTLIAARDGDTLFGDSLPDPGDWDQLDSLVDIAFPEEERQDAQEVLAAVRLFSRQMLEKSQDDIDERLHQAVEHCLNERLSEFAGGAAEHRRALELLQQFESNPPTIGKVMVVIAALSTLHVPLIPVDELLGNGTGTAGIPRVDDALEPVLHRFAGRPFNELVHDATELLQEVNLFQEQAGVVATRDMETVEMANVLGTHEWFEELLRQLKLKRGQKKMLRGLLAGSQIENEEMLRILSTQGRKCTPPFMRTGFRLFVLFQDRLASQFRWTNWIYDGLESLGLRSFRAVQNAVLTFYPLLATLTLTDTRAWCRPSLSICHQQENLVLALGAGRRDVRIRHAILRSILDSLRHRLTTPSSEPLMLLCPIGAARPDSPACGPSNACMVCRLLRFLPGEALVICCRAQKGRLLRKAENSRRFNETARLGLVVHHLDGRNENKEAADNGVPRPPVEEPVGDGRTAEESRALRFVIRVLLFVVTCLEKTLLAPVGLVVHVCQKNFERRQRKIEEVTEGSVSDMWLLLDRIARRAADRRHR